LNIILVELNHLNKTRRFLLWLSFIHNYQPEVNLPITYMELVERMLTTSIHMSCHSCSISTCTLHSDFIQAAKVGETVQFSTTHCSVNILSGSGVWSSFHCWWKPTRW